MGQKEAKFGVSRSKIKHQFPRSQGVNMFPENWLYHLEIIHKGLRLGKSRNVFLSVLSFQSDPASVHSTPLFYVSSRTFLF
ncbi:hypothetical protein CapIbe_004826 [Capra ibex]